MNPFLHALFAASEIIEGIPKNTLLQDHSYSSWSHPSNVYHNGINYFTTIGGNGQRFISKYENGTIQTVEIYADGLQKDEHNRPSFILRENDILIIIHPRLSSNYYTRTISYDFQTIGVLQDISSQVGISNGSYAQVFQFGNRIIVFSRDAAVRWSAFWSDDGVNWTNKKIIVEKSGTEQLYLSGHKNGDNIVFGVVYHPKTEENNRLFCIEINGVTGEMKEAGISLGNIYSENFVMVNTSNLTPVFIPDSSKKLRLLDVSVSSGKINFLLAHFLQDNSNGQYVFKQINQSNLSSIIEIEIIDHGYDTYETYFGGAYFVKNDNAEWNNTIYLARNENNIWTVEEWYWDGFVFTKVQEIDSLPAGVNGLSLTRPEPPVNSMNGGLKVIYQKGDYNESYTNWDNEIIGII